MKNWAFSDRLVTWLRIGLGLTSIFLTVYFCFCVPPMEKPDENLHFYKTIAVSQGNWICQINDTGPVNFIPLSVYQFVSTHLEHASLSPNIATATTETINETASCVLPFFYYLLPGLGVRLLLNMGLTLPAVFFLGRAINAVMALIIVGWCLRKLSPKLQLIPLYICSLPMVAYQISSYSKDAYHLALGMVVVSLIWRGLEKHAMKGFELAVLWLSCLFFILTRVQYVPFIFLLMLLPKNLHLGQKINLGRYSAALLVGGMLLVVSIIFGLLLSQNVYATPYNENPHLVFHDLIDPQQQLWFVMAQPGQFILVVLRSLTSFWVFYIKGAIGILGWLDKPLSNWVYLIYMLVAGWITVLLALSREIWPMKYGFWLYLLSGLATFLSLFFFMYLYSSPVKGELVLGVQGRYFIMLLPLLMITSATLIQTGLVKFGYLSAGMPKSKKTFSAK